MFKYFFYLGSTFLITMNVNSNLISNVFNNDPSNTYTKDDVSLNCFGIPKTIFSEIVDDIFSRTTKAEDVRFYFYYRNQTKNVTVQAKTKNIDLKKINFSTERQTVVIVHGFLSSGKEEWVKEMANAFLLLDDLNVIVVDWQRGSNTWNYYEASLSTNIVGTEIANLLYKIKQRAQKTNSLSDNYRKLYCVGHSLGAHICGSASNQIKKIEIKDQVKWDVQRITGLDPAQPCFGDADPLLKLDKNDASFVDVIHTNARHLLLLGFGLPGQIGKADYYPNGGQIQLGCDKIDNSIWDFITLPVKIITTAICSHGRSHELFTDSILVKVLESCTYRGRIWNQKYDNLTALLKDDCNSTCPELGIDSINYYTPGENKMYFVPTGDKPHYCEITKENRLAIAKQLQKDQHLRDTPVIEPVLGFMDRLFG